MGEETPDADSFHQAVQSIISQHLVSGDSAYVRMSRLALQELYFNNIVTSDEVVNGLHQLTTDDVQSVAQSLLNAGLPTITLVGPVSQELLTNVGEMLGDLGTLHSIGFVSADTLIPPVSKLGPISSANIQQMG
jgi:hypothetical protein